MKIICQYRICTKQIKKILFLETLVTKKGDLNIYIKILNKSILDSFWSFKDPFSGEEKPIIYNMAKYTIECYIIVDL